MKIKSTLDVQALINQKVKSASVEEIETHITEAHSWDFSEIEILADDGRALFSLRLKEHGTIEITANSHCKHDETVLDQALFVIPQGRHTVAIQRFEM